MAEQFDPKAWIKAHEGYRDDVYLDTRGLPTVGVGHLVTPQSPYGIAQAQVGDTFDEKILNQLYDEDYVKHEKMAKKNFKNFSDHPPHVQEALMNMTYQLGNKPKKWRNFQKALKKGLKTGNYQDAAYHASDSKWFHQQTPKRARSVLDRLAHGSGYNYNRPEELGELPDYAMPTDQWKKMRGYAYGSMTNPEAGPSDTVPAMLTPGEAVIPASVAMDEDYKPVIKEMVEEGRERNRAAESMGIPVNHPHAVGLSDGALDAKISKLYNEGYTAKGQAYAIAKNMGYASGGQVNPEGQGWSGPGFADGLSFDDAEELEMLYQDAGPEGELTGYEAMEVPMPDAPWYQPAVDAYDTLRWKYGEDTLQESQPYRKDWGGQLDIISDEERKMWHHPERLKDFARGAKRGKQIYDAIDKYDTWARETPLVPAIPGWDEKMDWKDMVAMAPDAIRYAELAGRTERQAGEAADWLGDKYADAKGALGFAGGRPQVHPTVPPHETVVDAYRPAVDMITDFVPGVGEAKDIARGDYAMAALGVVPVVGDAAARAVKFQRAVEAAPNVGRFPDRGLGEGSRYRKYGKKYPQGFEGFKKDLYENAGPAARNREDEFSEINLLKEYNYRQSGYGGRSPVARGRLSRESAEHLKENPEKLLGLYKYLGRDDQHVGQLAREVFGPDQITPKQVKEIRSKFNQRNPKSQAAWEVFKKKHGDNPVTVYRAGDPQGFSWTDNIDYARSLSDGRELTKATVDPDNILAIYGNRDEIIIPSRAVNILEKGYQGGTEMIPKPLGAPPKYNVERPDHSEFNVPTENMGEGVAMDLANAKHRQQVANKEGDHAQKMDHQRESDYLKLQMQAAKDDQKLAAKMAEKNLEMQTKLLEADVDSEVARRKQAALTTSMAGLGMIPPPVEAPPAPVGPDEIPGYAGGTDRVAQQAEMIRNLQAAGVSMEDIGKYLSDEIGAIGAPPPGAAAPPPEVAVAVEEAVTPAGIDAMNIPGVAEAATAMQNRQRATRDIARQAFGAEEEARAWDAGVAKMKGYADGAWYTQRVGDTRNKPATSKRRTAEEIYEEAVERARKAREKYDELLSKGLVPPSSPYDTLIGKVDALSDRLYDAGYADGTWWENIPGAQAVYDFGASLADDDGVPVPASVPEGRADPSEFAVRMEAQQPTGSWDEVVYREEQNLAEAEKLKQEAASDAARGAIENNKALMAEAAKVANDPTADPALRQRAQKDYEEAERANLDNEAAIAETAFDEETDAITQQTVQDLATEGNDIVVNDNATDAESSEATRQVKEEAKANPSKWKATLGKVADWFGKNLLNNDELITAAVVYSANRLLGYDDQVALQQGSKFALQNRQQRKAGELQAQKAQDERSKFDYELGQREASDKRKAEHAEAIKAPEKAKKEAKELVGAYDQYQNAASGEIQDIFTQAIPPQEEGGIQPNVTSGEAARQARNFFSQTFGSAVNDANFRNEMQEITNAATRQMIDYQAQNPKKKVSDIRPFLEKAQISSKLGAEGRTAFVTNPEETDERKRKEVDAKKMSNLAGRMRRLRTDDGQQVDPATKTRELWALWNKQSPEYRNRYERRAKGSSTNGFFVFMDEAVSKASRS